jgi:hypothetical protein
MMERVMGSENSSGASLSLSICVFLVVGAGRNAALFGFDQVARINSPVLGPYFFGGGRA